MQHRQRIALATLIPLLAFTVHLATTSQVPAKKAVIFDLGGVIFHTDYLGALKHMGFWNSAAYFLTGHSHSAFKQKLFSVLNNIPCPMTPATNATYQGEPFPSLMTAWQRGILSSSEIMKLLQPLLQERNENIADSREWTMMAKAFELMFDAQCLAKVTKPVTRAVNLVRFCKKRGYSVYVLSNMDKETMQELQKTYPDIFKLFDGVVYSAGIGHLKPEPPIYHYLLSTYHLNPQDCIFIDDQKENVLCARALGIRSFLCTPQFLKNARKKIQALA